MKLFNIQFKKVFEFTHVTPDGEFVDTNGVHHDPKFLTDDYKNREDFKNRVLYDFRPVI